MADGLVRQMAIGVGWNIDDSGLVQANNSTDGLVNSADNASNSMNGLSRSGEQAGSRLSRAFDGFNDKLQSGLDYLEDMRYRLAGIAAAGSAALFGAVNQAGNLEERLNTLNREFGSASRQVLNWANSYARATELSEMQLTDFAATLGINLRMLDLNSEETAGLTQELIELTHNYSHFMDMDPERAFQSIHQAIRGGRFPRALRDLTGQVRRTDIETRALNQGLIEQGEEMTQQAERIATISLLIEQLAITQGAAEEGQEEWNTRLGRFRGLLGDITREVGMMYLPTFSRGLDVTNNFLDALKENRLLKVGAGIVGLTTAVAGLGAGIGFLKWGLGKVVPLLTTSFTLFAGLTIPAWGLALAIIGLGLAAEDLWVGLQGGDSLIFDIAEAFRDWWDILKEDWNSSPIVKFFKGLKQDWGELDNQLSFEGFNIEPPEFSWEQDIIEPVRKKWNGLTNWLNKKEKEFEWPNLENFTWKGSIKQPIQSKWNDFLEWTGIEFEGFNWPNLDDFTWEGSIKKPIQQKWNNFLTWVGIDFKEFDWPKLTDFTWEGSIKEPILEKWDTFINWKDGLLDDFKWPTLPKFNWDFGFLDPIKEKWNNFTDEINDIFDNFKWPKLPKINLNPFEWVNNDNEPEEKGGLVNWFTQRTGDFLDSIDPFNNNEAEATEIEKEINETQQQISNNQSESKVTNNNDITINIDGRNKSDDELVRKIGRTLGKYIDMEAAEAGVN